MEEFFTFPELCLTFDLNLIQQGFDLFSPGDSAAERRCGTAGSRPAQTVFQRACRIFKRSQKARDHRIASPDSADGLTRQRTLPIDAALRCKEN